MMGWPFHYSGIDKRFGSRRLLAIAALDLPPGSCTALVGSNGAGKTTLLKILAGLEPPQQARVRRGDGPVQTWQQARAALRREVVYLHQFPYMFDASVGDNVAYGLARAHMQRRERRRRVEEVLSRVGLAPLIDADAKRLSGGERQRIALARALVLEPDLLLLDEPTASMDRQAREHTVPLLRQLKESGLSMMIVTHDIATLDTLPDVRLQLADGHLGTLYEHDDAPECAYPTQGAPEMAPPLRGTYRA